MLIAAIRRARICEAGNRSLAVSASVRFRAYAGVVGVVDAVLTGATVEAFVVVAWNRQFAELAGKARIANTAKAVSSRVTRPKHTRLRITSDRILTSRSIKSSRARAAEIRLTHRRTATTVLARLTTARQESLTIIPAVLWRAEARMTAQIVSVLTNSRVLAGIRKARQFRLAKSATELCVAKTLKVFEFVIGNAHALVLTRC